jgi:hypothetical protein
VVCVSEPFREHLGGGENVFAIPNAADPWPEGDRDALRASLGIGSDETAFVYAGSQAPWQCAEPAVRLFTALRERSPSARLALLTHDLAEGRSLARTVGGADVIVRSLTPEATLEMLPAFDAAFLLREASVVNRVAAPVKFAEYLHAGLPVILTEGIGDASRWVSEHGLGIVLPAVDAPDNAARVADGLPGLDGSLCRAFARERLTFDVTVPLYERALEAARRSGA